MLDAKIDGELQRGSDSQPDARNLKRQTLIAIAGLTLAIAVGVFALSAVLIPFLGAERTTWQYPFASVLRHGARLAAGSDWPVTSANPMLGATFADPWRFQANPEVYVLVVFLIGAYVYSMRVIGPRAVAIGRAEGRAEGMLRVPYSPAGAV